MSSKASSSLAEWLAPLSKMVRNRLGLHVPEEHWQDLHRNFLEATKALGYTDPSEYLQWLMRPDLPEDELHKLAGFLTIGETYFFREKDRFEPMARHILSDLIHKKRQLGQKQLRIWSAACSTGEEPYSLAILLDAMLPDIRAWSIRILATDINPVFLERARKAVYRPWSFRGTPEWVKARYFQVENDNYTLNAKIRDRVSFDFLNLADDVYPSLNTQTQALDLVFCRNVLIYFDHTQARKVIGRMRQALVEGGWLVLSPTETVYVTEPALHREYIEESILYRKDSTRQTHSHVPFHKKHTGDHLFHHKHKPPRHSGSVTPLKKTADITRPSEAKTPAFQQPSRHEKRKHASIHKKAESLYAKGEHRETIRLIQERLNGQPPSGHEAYLLARAHANLGNLDEALRLVNSALESDKLQPEHHYLLAIIQLEKNLLEEAGKSLQRVIYLDDQYVMAFFSLGHLSIQQQKLHAAEKYFQHALQILDGFDSNAVLDEGEGMTAGRLRELIRAGLPANKGN